MLLDSYEPHPSYQSLNESSSLHASISSRLHKHQKKNSDKRSIQASVKVGVDPSLQFDDKSFALELQLEEIEAQREFQFHKYSYPNFVLVFNELQTIYKKGVSLIMDLTFAHSIARLQKTIDAKLSPLLSYFDCVT